MRSLGGKGAHEKLYMKTTGDKLDLPVAVADSPGELARILGTKKSVVLSSISHKIRGWHRIEIEEEEEMERDV